MDNTCSSAKFANDWYFKVLVGSSLGLQILLYLVAPWRKRSTCWSVQGLISIIFALSNWIPVLTLILISSCVIFSYDRSTDRSATGCESALLTWASLMLLHLAGHGQERETPLSLQLGEIANESYKVILEFLFYSIIFLIAFFFHFESWNDDTLPETLAFALLACLKTFGKLKQLRNRCDEIKQESARQTTIHSCPWPPSETGQVMASNQEGVTLYNHYSFNRLWGFILGRSIKNDNLENSTYLDLNPTKACKIAEDELKLIYYKFYGGVAPSEFELLIITVILSVELSSSPFFIATIFLNNYVVIPNVILFIISNFKKSLLKVVKETEIPLLSTVLLVVPPLSKSLYITSMNFSNTLMYILLITHHLVAYPIMQTHYFHQVYRNDPYQWPRWSRTIQRFNMLTYSLQKPSKILAYIHHMLNTWPLSGKDLYEDDLGGFIFSELRNIIFCQSDDPHRKLNLSRQVIAAKGVWVIRKENHLDLVADCEAPFNERVLLWHMATGILYHTSSTNTRSSAASNRNRSMLLSDYMGYLLIVQPWIMSKQRGVVLRRCLEMWAEIYELAKDSDMQDLERICQEIISQQQSCSGKDQTKTVLQGAYVLAKKLESTFPDANQRWSFIVKVWVEKLAYAAIQCKTIDHVQGLSQGGELAGIVWLWMLHFENVSGSALINNSTQSEPQLMPSRSPGKSRPRDKKKMI